VPTKHNDTNARPATKPSPLAERISYRAIKRAVGISSDALDRITKKNKTKAV
jgi:hypothetical protein